MVRLKASTNFPFTTKLTSETKFKISSSTATPLYNYSSVLPPTENERQFAQINLHDIKVQNPSWTHLLLKFPKTNEAFKFTVDINNYDDRVLDVQMPKWYSFGQSQLLDDTALGASLYKLRVLGKFGRDC